MKVTDLGRKLRAALVAGGLLLPSTSYAADLDTNLVVNPGFENVDLLTTSYYNAPLILDWMSATTPPGPGFAYSHDYSGQNVPDFANGTLASGGHWYFTPGNYDIVTGSQHNSRANAITQTIDVSTGETGEAIANGNAAFDLSAFFSTYDGQPDRGFVRVEFISGAPGDYNADGTTDAADYVVFQKNVGTVSTLPNDPNVGTVIDDDQYNTWMSNFGESGGAVLGSAEINTPSGPALLNWTQISGSGFVPVGTASLVVASWGEVFEGSGGSADGYTDNIDFRIRIAEGGSGGSAVPEASAVLMAGIGLASLTFGGRRPTRGRSSEGRLKES
jgi:hypothetical protein